jgi:hypothetical protein
LPRLSASDLGVLGRYLYGPRWQSALARELGVSRQLVVYWASGNRPITEARSYRIAVIARARHDKRVASERSAYIAMAQGLSSNSARTLMLSLILNEAQERIAAVTRLTGQIERSVAGLAKLAREKALPSEPEVVSLAVVAEAIG